MSEDGHHHPAPVSPVEQRVAALEALLTERGLVPEGFIEEVTRRYESEIGPLNGAKVVARAWADPQYRERLLADGTAAIAELGFGGAEGDHMVVVENTPAVHNVIVCTLCSCYPWPVLGLPPVVVQGPPVPGPDGAGAPDRCWPRWAASFPMRSRSGSGIPPPRFAISCCPSARREPRA